MIYLILALLLGTSVAYGWTKDKGPAKLTLWGVDLSGLDKETAYHNLENQLPDQVVFQDKVFPITREETLERLREWLDFKYSRDTDNGIFNIFNYIKGTSDALSLPKFSDEEILPQLKAIGDHGLDIDLEATLQALNNSPDGSPVQMIVRTLKSSPSEEELAAINGVLGDFTTFYNPNNQERAHNLQLSAEAIEGHLIPPGKEFSFNGAVGERTGEKGYLPAAVYDDQNLALGEGGGICQTSTTLYQAALQAGLEITERHAHTLPVAYAPEGEDATVAYGELDLRFVNNTGSYVLISCQTDGDRLRIRLLGQTDGREEIAPRSFSLESGMIK